MNPELQAVSHNDLVDKCKHNPDQAHRSGRRIATERYQHLWYKRENEARQEFSWKQAVIDVEGQLCGSVVLDEDWGIAGGRWHTSRADLPCRGAPGCPGRMDLKGE